MYTRTKREEILLNLLFIVLVVSYLILGQLLIWNIPYGYPYGGPDEPMHLSMAEYIAKHLSWPQWDSTEVARNAYGVSYSPGGSIVYWLHGVSYRLLGYHRIGAHILLIVYLLLAIIAYRKNRLSGFLLLAGLMPQTLFVFSYINSDTGTLIAALLFGMSVGLFLVSDNIRNFLILLFFAGFTITAKLHLWAIAFLTLVWVILYKRNRILQFNKKIWLYAFLLGLLPASWWFITSYLANDGDPLGIFTSAKAIAKFGTPNLPSLAREWSSFSLSDFLQSTLISLYANWGWLSLPIATHGYILAALLAVVITGLMAPHIDKKIFIFFILLALSNFIFMIVYSVNYDYQAQGRYLFPSIYIILGILTIITILKPIRSKALLILLLLFNLTNLYWSTKLTLFSYLDTFLQKPQLLKVVPNYSFSKDPKYHIDGYHISERKLSIRGWIYDPLRNRPFDTVYLILRHGSDYYQVELEKESRPDVASAFGNKRLISSGFAAKLIDLSELPGGTYDYFFATESNGTFNLTDIGHKEHF